MAFWKMKWVLEKTIQSISLMAYLKPYKKKYGYFLVIVPKSTMTN